MLPSACRIFALVRVIRFKSSSSSRVEVMAIPMLYRVLSSAILRLAWRENWPLRMVAAIWRQMTGRQEGLVRVEGSGRFPPQHQNSVKENFVGDRKRREKREGTNGAASAFAPGAREIRTPEKGIFSPRNRGRELRPGLDRPAPAKRGARCWQT